MTPDGPANAFPLVSRWPTARPPPAATSIKEYDAQVRTDVSTGLALDERSIYYLTRLSPRYPTVEVRVADVCLTVDHAVAYAGLVRALVATTLDGCREVCRPCPCRRQCCVSPAGRPLGWASPDTCLIHGPASRSRRLRWSRVCSSWCVPPLGAWGDNSVVLPTLARLIERGGGAEIHRRVLHSVGTPSGFVHALSELNCSETSS